MKTQSLKSERKIMLRLFSSYKVLYRLDLLSLSHRYFHNCFYDMEHVEFSDILQECYISLWKYVEKIKPDNKYSKKQQRTHMTYCVERDIIDFSRTETIRGYNRKNKNSKRPTIMKGENAMCIMGKLRMVTKDIEREYLVKEITSKALKELSDHERSLMIFYSKGMTNKEIGKLFHLTESRISQKITKIKEKLRDYGKKVVKK